MEAGIECTSDEVEPSPPTETGLLEDRDDLLLVAVAPGSRVEAEQARASRSPEPSHPPQPRGTRGGMSPG